MNRPAIGVVTALVLGAPRLATAAGPGDGDRPAASATSHVVTETAQVLPKWTPSAGLTTIYSQSLYSHPTADGVSIVRRTTSHALFAFGIAGRAEFLADLPMILHQQGTAFGSGLQASALGDLRLGLKGTLLPTPRRGFGLGVLADVTAPTGDRDALTGTGGVTYSGRLLAEQTMGRGTTLAANLGYLGRPEQTYGPVRIGDAVTYAAALRVPLDRRGIVAWVSEVNGEVGVTHGARHPVSLRTGLRGRLRSGVILGLYGGGAPVSALGVPEAQAMFTVHWASPKRLRSERAFDRSEPTHATAVARRYEERDDLEAEAAAAVRDPADPDGDGLLAAADQCPSVAEDHDGFADDDGCPDLDNDGDGLRDVMDQCPTEPELVNGALDWDGCPDLVVDGKVVALAKLDPARLVPKVVFAPGTANLDENTRESMAAFAELMHLNPWLGTLALRVYVRPSGNAFADRRMAESRAHAVVTALTRAGVEPGRVEVRGARAVGGEVPERAALAWLADEPKIAEPAATETVDGSDTRLAGTEPTLDRLLDQADSQARQAAAVPDGEASLAQGPPAQPETTQPTKRQPPAGMAPPPPTFVRSPLSR